MRVGGGANLESELTLAIAAATPEEGPNVALIAGASVGGVAALILACVSFAYRRRFIAACARLRGRRDGASSGSGSRFGSTPRSGSARRDDGFDDPATIDPSPSRRDDPPRRRRARSRGGTALGVPRVYLPQRRRGRTVRRVRRPSTRAIDRAIARRARRRRRVSDNLGGARDGERFVGGVPAVLRRGRL